jgi:hypothetical protein
VPASIGVARCTGILGESCAEDTELFGQINASEIVALEVLTRERGTASRLAAPGYIVRLDSFSGVPTAYRWLDADGDVLWFQ